MEKVIGQLYLCKNSGFIVLIIDFSKGDDYSTRKLFDSVLGSQNDK